KSKRRFARPITSNIVVTTISMDTSRLATVLMSKSIVAKEVNSADIVETIKDILRILAYGSAAVYYITKIRKNVKSKK
ncbi:MAG: hypothetical protein FWC89_04360, partial [Defluviitaleaceae bacterium]|nr:hypothetical protein [Defluviitaleaceae bacterium]